MTDRTLEARRLDILDEMRQKRAHGIPCTVRAVGHGLYNKARRAFGSWTEALEALDAADHDFGSIDDLAVTDVISPVLIPGLPRYVRERQIVGGLMLERFAKIAMRHDDVSCLADPTSVFVAEALREAFNDALGEWWRRQDGERRHFAMTELLRTSEGAVFYGTHGIRQEYAPGETTAGVDLPNEAPAAEVAP